MPCSCPLPFAPPPLSTGTPCFFLQLGEAQAVPFPPLPPPLHGAPATAPFPSPPSSHRAGCCVSPRLFLRTGSCGKISFLSFSGLKVPRFQNGGSLLPFLSVPDVLSKDHYSFLLSFGCSVTKKGQAPLTFNRACLASPSLFSSNTPTLFLLPPRKPSQYYMLKASSLQPRARALPPFPRQSINVFSPTGNFLQDWLTRLVSPTAFLSSPLMRQCVTRWCPLLSQPWASETTGYPSRSREKSSQRPLLFPLPEFRRRCFFPLLLAWGMKRKSASLRASPLCPQMWGVPGAVSHSAEGGEKNEPSLLPPSETASVSLSFPPPATHPFPFFFPAPFFFSCPFRRSKSGTTVPPFFCP